ncbi:aminotransferase class V-fold PLP-dependent enzyme [Streptomyces sp. NBC_01352]|uniref:Pyridoxal-dependent decarboxylase n=1 Tax=Streptomyces plumbiresistens TaxID=511811 RepID=A0ABP7TLU8_9ACTN|nr:MULTISPECIES: aminotransferase class V-fold PLP-dependent enzyme [unclassified Streptomyces]MCX4704090.1 aminotransferase class V-fold PLP-dependent enzyme [Streptomyces sp. NBC_01373]
MPDLEPDEFRRQGHQLVDWVAQYRASLPSLRVQPNVSPGSVKAQLPRELPEQPSQALGDDLVALLNDVVVPSSLHWQHPGFFGYFPANASLLSLLGDIASGGIGAQGMLWSTSPAGTEIEQVLLDGLADALGLGREFTFAGGGGGSLQDSASSASLAALLAALQRSNPDWREHGVDGTETVYVTAETHSSLAKAVRVAGLGARALRIVPFTQGTLSMSADALADMLAKDAAAGKRPVMVCPTVGTTGTGAIDPVRDIALAAREYQAWVHVDAAWAGVAALCPEFRWLLDGVNLADSFCTDAHKWFYTAFDASFMWVRDAQALPTALSITPEYLRNAATESGEVIDYRDWQVPLGRRMRALKIWSVVHGAGLEGLRESIRGHVAMADSLAARIESEPGFALATPPSLALVCLYLVDRDGRPDDAATKAAMEAVNAEGHSFLTHTSVNGHFAIRVAIGATTTLPDHIDTLWDSLRKAARQSGG